MKAPCQAQHLFGEKCEYNGEVDTEKDAYSIRRMDGKDYYYHYLCYTRQSYQMVSLRPKHKTQLCSYLLNLKGTGRNDNWISGVLFACGYKDE
jgi:hypothetical protein